MEKPIVKIVSMNSLNINKDMDEGKYAQLTWSIRAGYPRITVFTDQHRDRAKDAKFDYNTLIIAPFDYITMGTLINQFVEIIDGPTETTRQIKCFNTMYKNGEKTNEIVLQATAEIGKDKDGVMYIAIIAEGKKKVKFEIKPKDNSKWHKYFKNGDLLTDAGEISRIYARSYIEQARRLLNHHMVIDSTKEKVLEPKHKAPLDSNVNTSTASDNDITGLF